MPVSVCGGDAAARGAVDESVHEEVRLVDVLDGAAVLAEGGSQGFDADRAAGELVDDGHEVVPVVLVESELIDVEDVECHVGDLLGDTTVETDIREVTYTLQQAVRESRRAAGAQCDTLSAGVVNVYIQHLRGTSYDLHQLLSGVELELRDDTETVTKRCGQQTRTGRRANQREVREIQADRARRGVLSQHDIDGEVFHRRVQYLLDLAVQAVDLVDEQHIALRKTIQNRGDLARLLDGRTRGYLDIHPELIRDDVTDGRLAQSRRAVKQAVIQRLSAVLRRLNIDLQHLLQLTLADVVIERLRTDLRLQLPILYRLICIDYSTFQLCTSLRTIIRIYLYMCRYPALK